MFAKKSFIARYLLDQYMRSPTEKRPYACKKCARSFRYQSNVGSMKKFVMDNQNFSKTKLIQLII